MGWARVVGPGHPDAVCDAVAVVLAEEYLRRDPAAWIDLRVCGGGGAIFVTGRVHTNADFDLAALIKRTVATADIQSDDCEPFITIEVMHAAWMLPGGGRDGAHVFGYATNETSDTLPPDMSLARALVRRLENKRRTDSDWFWLSGDYEISVSRDNYKYLIEARLPHLDAMSVAQVREAFSGLCADLKNTQDVYVNLAGDEHVTGIAKRVGSSRVAWGGYGYLLPSNLAGHGLSLLHPLNVGAWLARSLARQCLAQGCGEAIMVHADWRPLDTKPCRLRIRNERGQELSDMVETERFDLARLPDRYRDPALLMQAFQSWYREDMVLPWEGK